MTVPASLAPAGTHECKDRRVVVDVSSWATIAPENGGRDERKVWLSPTPDADREDWWLWKPLKRTDRDAWRTNDVSEVVAHRMAEAIGLPAALCEYARKDGERGAISQNIAPHTHLMAPGSTLVPPGDTYTVERIIEALDGLTGPPPHHTHLPAAEIFAGYLVLDAWIGNTDRHEENWATIEAPDGSAYIAPAYDHGSALGSGLTDVKRASCDRQAWCARGRSTPFAKRSLVDLAAEAVSLTGAGWWADRVAAVHPPAWTGILDEHGALSVVSHSFVSDVLTTNQERVSRACRP